jgi:pentatricopeptide repeat protein
MSTLATEVWAFIMTTRLELLLFFAAMAIYMLLFSNRLPKSDTRKSSSKAKAAAGSAHSGLAGSQDAKSTEVNAESYSQVERSMQAAIEEGDHRSVLKCWNAFKQFDRAPPAIHLPNVVESLQRFKKDNPYIVQELKAVFKRNACDCDISMINDILDSLARRHDTSLMDQIVQMLPSLDLKRDQKTFEIFLSMHLTTRCFNEVQKLVTDMKKDGVPFNTRILTILIKASLRTNGFAEALEYFKELKAIFLARGGWPDSPSAAPRHIVAQLADLACKDRQLGLLLPELEGAPLTEEAINVMLNECIRLRDCELARSVEELARAQGGSMSDSTLGLLIKALTSDPERVRAIVSDVLEHRPADCSAEFAISVLSFCGKTADVALADKLYTVMKPTQANVLNALIRFYSENDQQAKACDIFEKDLQASAGACSDVNMPRPPVADARMERSLMNAALQCGRTSLAKTLLEASPSDVAKHISMIRNCASEGNLKGAFEIFASLEQSGIDLNSIIYNTVLDACVQCHDLKAAEQWIEQMKTANMLDVVSFNTLIKAHLMNHKLDKARGLMQEMKKLGLQPNRVTYNELINGIVASHGRKDDIWEVVREMKDAGITPNQVTCSILLKNLNSYSAQNDILLTMDFINSMEEEMDEVLMSSMVEACVRIGQPELLASKLKAVQDGGNLKVSGSHTFGSLIKAYGHARDVDGIWRCWKEMRSRHIKPTSITLGCMIEAVVSNDDTEGAYELIHEMQSDEHCRSALNSVIYCSVLKGFTREKKLDRVFAVYEEMTKWKIELSIVTFNTVIDACARCNRMDKVPCIVQDMRDSRIRPNVITYSTMMKGHCQAGDVHTGFALLKQLKSETTLKPDEIMYNSLLDGCAQHNLVDEGLQLLKEMEDSDVAPSNFTLSLLVKLMNRARKLDEAFRLVNDLSKKFRFSPNVHVYTNLIQACVSNRQLNRGFDTLALMIKERVKPESRTYCVLVRACMSQGQHADAVALLRGALGLPGAHDLVANCPCPKLDHALVNETLHGLLANGFIDKLAAPLLTDMPKGRQKVRIDPAISHKIMCIHAGRSYDEKPSQKGGYSKGKGKGQRNAY